MGRRGPMLVHYTDRIIVLYEDEDGQASTREVTQAQANELVARGMSFTVVHEPAPTKRSEQGWPEIIELKYSEYNKYTKGPLHAQTDQETSDCIIEVKVATPQAHISQAIYYLRLLPDVKAARIVDRHGNVMAFIRRK